MSFPDWGDVPTWVTAGVALAALLGASLAYRAQSAQLELQRKQLADQQEATRLQAQVIADQNRVQEREQANLVDVSHRPIDSDLAQVLQTDKSEPVHMVVVSNGSRRPIREVTVKAELIREYPDRCIRDELAYGWGRLEVALDTKSGQVFFPGEPSSTMPVLRAGETAGFVWDFTTAMWELLISSVRFTDDAGLHWEIDGTLHLEKLAEHDW
jgi:hypothetical protein